MNVVSHGYVEVTMLRYRHTTEVETLGANWC